MEYRKSTTAAMAASSDSSDPSSPPPPPPPVILRPCGACKFLRRRCFEKCVLGPYFPPTEPLKFTIVRRVFGASNITKWLQKLPEAQRADAVNSMVYEANARLSDPIYGCTRAICHLQNQISELQAELAKAQAEILNLQRQIENLLEQFRKQMATQNVEENLPRQTALPYDHENSTSFFSDEGNLGVSGINLLSYYLLRQWSRLGEKHKYSHLNSHLVFQRKRKGKMNKNHIQKMVT